MHGALESKKTLLEFEMSPIWRWKSFIC